MERLSFHYVAEKRNSGNNLKHARKTKYEDGEGQNKTSFESNGP